MSNRFLLATAVAVLLVVTGCRERDDLAGDTVRVTYPDKKVELDVVSCGLDGDVFVLAAASADAVVQLLLVSDGDEVDRAASAFTVEVAGDGVLGAGSAALLQVAVSVPGELDAASIRGDRVDVTASARRLDGTPADEVIGVEVAARCPAVDDFV
ncbi:hypothetical protein [Actinospongicola halichondriae]|uniref:hypothetical protein n=1 Tax=Actinospongicola halichondriae TaxID=3236844 RepID=UPI003D4D0A9A